MTKLKTTPNDKHVKLRIELSTDVTGILSPPPNCSPARQKNELVKPVALMLAWKGVGYRRVLDVKRQRVRAIPTGNRFLKCRHASSRDDDRVSE